MQEWIVGLIVACAFLAVARRYMPKSLRRALRNLAARTARRLGWERIAARFEIADQAAASCGDGCGSCGGCASDAPSPVTDERFVIKLKTVK